MPKFGYHDKLEIHIEMSLIGKTGHFHFIYYKHLTSM